VFGGAGVANHSAGAPSFIVANGGVVAATPSLSFTSAASAGNSVIANTDGGVTVFFSGAVFVGSSTAGNALITNN